MREDECFNFKTIWCLVLEKSVREGRKKKDKIINSLKIRKSYFDLKLNNRQTIWPIKMKIGKNIWATLDYENFQVSSYFDAKFWRKTFQNGKKQDNFNCLLISKYKYNTPHSRNSFQET